MTRFARLRISLAVAACAAAALFSAARAQTGDAVADFYSGKTVRVLVGFGAGGGYDLYARTLSSHMGRHIPGKPTLVVQNMPGAGSLRVVNYLYNVAPRDGTVIATFARGIVLEPLMGRAEGTQFDAPKFTWIGSVSNEVSVCAFMDKSGIKTWEDMRTKKYMIGASGTGADSDVFPSVLRNLFKLPLKIVTGYAGGADLVLAMERHEIDGRCGWSWTSLISRSRALYDSGKINLTLQIALQPHENLAKVPLLTDLSGDPRDKAALKLIISRQSFARPFAAPPEIPAERAQALRAAFDATMKDAEFLAEAKRLELEVRPLGGPDVEALLREVYASPAEIVKHASEIMRETAAP
jgi:tripartite-type tricarboxylate transporter receptor subunit TctC